MKINIPFKEQFREAMLSGTKTVTSRTKRYGKAGDTFMAFGQEFILTAVARIPICATAETHFKSEGFASPKEFWECWRQIHPRKKWDAGDEVWAHWFRRKWVPVGTLSANVEKPVVKSKVIYLVNGCSGEHEDYETWAIAAYTDKALAEQRASNARDEVKKFIENWNSEEENAYEKLDAFKNPYDPNMSMDLGGVCYFVQEVELIENERRE